MNYFDHSSGTHLAIDGAEIYVETFGNQKGPALLFLHGGFGNIEDFNIIAPELSSQYKIIGIDSRGHGKSTINTTELTYERLQNDVEHILTALNIKKLSIIGFSDGGIIGYRLASLTSLNIESLVTVGADWHIKNTAPLKNLFLNITADSWKKKFPHSYEHYQKLNPLPDFELLTQCMIKMWLDPNPSGYPNECVKNIRCPVFMVRGNDDHLLTKEAVTELSLLIKHSTVLHIPFAGHIAFEDQKEIFIKNLHEFLRTAVSS